MIEELHLSIACSLQSPAAGLFYVFYIAMQESLRAPRKGVGMSVVLLSPKRAVGCRGQARPTSLSQRTVHLSGRAPWARFISCSKIATFTETARDENGDVKYHEGISVRGPGLRCIDQFRVPGRKTGLSSSPVIDEIIMAQSLPSGRQFLLGNLGSSQSSGRDRTA